MYELHQIYRVSFRKILLKFWPIPPIRVVEQDEVCRAPPLHTALLVLTKNF